MASNNRGLDPTQLAVFFYGLFMDIDYLKQCGLQPSAAKPVSVDGYGLRIGERASLAKASRERCYGMLIQLKDAELELLYGEDSVADYEPVELVTTDQSGHQQAAISYLLPMSKLTGQNHHYASLLATTAIKIGLPGEYIEEIKTWMSRNG